MWQSTGRLFPIACNLATQCRRVQNWCRSGSPGLRGTCCSYGIPMGFLQACIRQTGPVCVCPCIFPQMQEDQEVFSTEISHCSSAIVHTLWKSMGPKSHWNQNNKRVKRWPDSVCKSAFALAHRLLPQREKKREREKIALARFPTEDTQSKMSDK